MLTTLTILSRDQGSIYGVKRGQPANEITSARLNVCECRKQGGRSALPAPALGSLLRRLAFALTTTRRHA